jgi:CRP-like cAMP-binding protein
VPANTSLFSEGDQRDSMYAVLDGAVDIFVGGELVETVEKGGIFGEMALIEKDTRGATAVTRGESRVVAVDEKRFLFLVQQTPNFSLHVMKVLSVDFDG